MLDFSQTCSDSSPTTLGIFDLSIAPELLFYAYIPISILSLIIGLIFLLYSPKRNLARVFFLLTLSFSIYIFNELIQWILVPTSLMYFTWSLSILFQVFILKYSLRFLWLSIYEKDTLPTIVSSLVLLPVIIFLPTTLNLVSFDSNYCEAQIGVLWSYLHVIVLAYLLLLLIWTIALLFQKPIKAKRLYLVISSLVFISIFFASNIFGDITNYHEMNLFGPMGMLMLIILSGYTNLKFKIFKIKTFQAQLLVILLLFLLGSQFFLVTGTASQYMVALTFLISVFASLRLIRSVRSEVLQREQIEKLAESLEKANNRLRELDKQKSEFVSIASHQLRSPLTAMRGYASMMIEGSYGPVTEKQHQVLEQIINSGKMMASSIEDYLSISRIESGNMKYEMSEFNLKDLTQNLVEELQPEATKAGLILHFASELDREGVVNADKGKVYQIIHNLVNNSLKYTPKGAVTVLVKDDEIKKNIMVQISDTGIGMNQATIAKLFEKFSRAENANSVNIKGTGLGLYVARSLAHAMKGEVTAASEGDGKGSTFTFTIPYVR